MIKEKPPIIEKFDIPAPREDLAERIISASISIEQHRSLQQKIRSFFDALITPPLSYGLACAVFVCFLIAGIVSTETLSLISPQQSSTDYEISTLLDDIFNDEDNNLLIL